MEEVQTPVEQPAVETPEKEVESKPGEQSTTPEAPTTPEVDRSAYNCTNCGGEGLVADGFEEGGFVICPACQGTGKV